MTQPPVILAFWEPALAAEGFREELLPENPTQWKPEIDEFTRKQRAVDPHIEHWICGYKVPQRD